MKTVVLAYADAGFGHPIASSLGREGLNVVPVLMGEDPAEQILDHSPDLVLIDDASTERSPTGRSPVGRTGVVVIDQVRRRSAVPVIMLAQDDNEDRIVQALDVSADDYLVSPISVRELAARIAVNLRRVHCLHDDADHADHIVRAGPVTLNTE